LPSPPRWGRGVSGDFWGGRGAGGEGMEGGDLGVSEGSEGIRGRRVGVVAV